MGSWSTHVYPQMAYCTHSMAMNFVRKIMIIHQMYSNVGISGYHIFRDTYISLYSIYILVYMYYSICIFASWRRPRVHPTYSPQIALLSWSSRTTGGVTQLHSEATSGGWENTQDSDSFGGLVSNKTRSSFLMGYDDQKSAELSILGYVSTWVVIPFVLVDIQTLRWQSEFD